MAQAWGDITAFGTTNPKIHSGSRNYNVVRVKEGIYLIDFNDGVFKGTPAFVVTQQFSGNSSWNDFGSDGGNTRDNAVLIAIDNVHAKLKTGDEDGDAKDRNFSFIAIGD